MRKIPREYEHPLDNVLLDWADATLPLVRALGLNPNQVTVGSAALGGLAVWALAAGRLRTFLAAHFLSNFLDYVDGHYARSDNMVTVLGDWLDHGSDVLYVLAFAAVVAYKTGWPGMLQPLGVLALFCVLSQVHLGCQQRYYKRHRQPGEYEPETLDAAACLCRSPDDDGASWLRFTRFFGVATLQIVFALVAYYYVFRRNAAPK